jgi:hypothetical protein
MQGRVKTHIHEHASIVAMSIMIQREIIPSLVLKGKASAITEALA